MFTRASLDRAFAVAGRSVDRSGLPLDVRSLAESVSLLAARNQSIISFELSSSSQSAETGRPLKIDEANPRAAELTFGCSNASAQLLPIEQGPSVSLCCLLPLSRCQILSEYPNPLRFALGSVSQHGTARLSQSAVLGTHQESDHSRKK